MRILIKTHINHVCNGKCFDIYILLMCVFVFVCVFRIISKTVGWILIFFYLLTMAPDEHKGYFDI